MHVVINRSDAIGDVLLAMPMAGALKKRLPGCRVTFVVAERTRPLFEGHPHVDGLLVLPSARPPLRRLPALLKEMAALRARAYVHCGGSFLPTLAAFLLGTPLRGGLLSRWPSFLLLNRGVRQSRTRDGRHESELNLDLLAPLGAGGERMEDHPPVIGLPPGRRAALLSDFREEVGRRGVPWGRPMVVVHPGMAGSSLNWPTENYARLIAEMERRRPGAFLFVVSATPADGPRIRPFEEALEREARVPETSLARLDGRRGLAHDMAVISHAGLVVAPSTGITHVANALSVPQVAIYPPIRSQSPGRWGPFRRGPRTVVLKPAAPCGQDRSCAGPRCPDHECMPTVAVESVCEAAMALLGAQKTD